MIGAIAGDIIGSVYERQRIKIEEFPLFGRESRFTDDTVMTVAVADCLLTGKEYAATFREYGTRYPHAGYGASFGKWLVTSGMGPYDSFGNGSAMRVSPVGFAAGSLNEALAEAARSAAVSHNHPEGIKGAQAVAAAIFLARQGLSKEEIRDHVGREFGYDLHHTIDRIRPGYQFDLTCQGTVPEALVAFFDSTDYEDAIRKAISLGGDSDTLACITGGVAQAFYRQIPAVIIREVRSRLTPDLRTVVDTFLTHFPP
jgi:ADP-ribosylglycohydrolase